MVLPFRKQQRRQLARSMWQNRRVEKNKPETNMTTHRFLVFIPARLLIDDAAHKCV